MLDQWAVTLERGLETMIADARAGRLVDDTLVQDYNYIRHLMGRRDVLRWELEKEMNDGGTDESEGTE